MTKANLKGCLWIQRTHEWNWGDTVSPKGADEIANSVDPDQTALYDQFDQGLHCLLRPICPNTYHHYGKKKYYGIGYLDRISCAIVIIGKCACFER